MTEFLESDNTFENDCNHMNLQNNVISEMINRDNPKLSELFELLFCGEISSLMYAPYPIE